MADLRQCIGSAKFGIEAHDAPIGDFPTQPSQKDGLGRMCRPHWREYVRALGKARTAAKAPGVVERLTRSALEAGATVTIKPVRSKPARGGTTPLAPEKVARVRKAKALIDAIDVLPGPEHVAAIATDEAQAALEVLSEHVPGTVIDETSPVALPDPQPMRDDLDEEAVLA